jgi:TonB-linked SusC/RagA family outer membrane protein
LESLSGLLPGLVITSQTSQPGSEDYAANATIRGEQAVVYVDGVIRDPSDLSPSEVEKVQVIKDLSGRAALGIYGSQPVLWITTKAGKSYNREMKLNAEYGASSATAIPEYVNAYDYATMYNEALVNDGLAPYYSNEAIQAYKDNSDPTNYPNINYLDKYVRPSAPFRRANINFSGGDNKVNYFSMISYAGSEGLEAVGEKYKSDRFKVRGNVNIKLTDVIDMNVNISGTYKTGRNPHNNIFSSIANLPSNAHPTLYNDQLIISNDYPVNLDNELIYSGFEQSSTLSTENNASLKFDLSEYVNGLSATAAVSFDASSRIVNGKFQNANLYRLTQAGGITSTELVTAEKVQADLSLVSSYIRRKTVEQVSVNYDRTFDKHTIAANAAFYQGMFEENYYSGYQPEKIQDFSLRANYTYDEKYVVQMDQVLSGSMRMPKGSRFELYPTIGLGWVASKESFLKDNASINFLKVNASLGIIGVNSFNLAGYNSYYLYQTLWQTSGSWVSGTNDKKANPLPGYIIKQAGSESYSVPKNCNFNLGLESSLFNNSLAVNLNYYLVDHYNLISQKQYYTPSIFGGGGFLPATNFGEYMQYGFDGMVQYTKSINDFTLSAGINANYMRGKYITVDEPMLEAEYRKYAGKQIDEYMMYAAEGLYQSQAEIDARNVTHTFGEVKPGDIKYTDYNNDGKIDEKDQYRSGAHGQRLFFGANLSVAYKGFKLKVVGQGVTDGSQMIASNSYTIVNGVASLSNSYFSSTTNKQNFSTAMLDRWSASNTDGTSPRLTTTSTNNMQRSTYWLVDGTYFRLKNVELSYTLPKAASKKLLMGNCTVFARGSNLLEFSNLSKYGVDPENMWAGNSMYPIYSTYTFGITCLF